MSTQSPPPPVCSCVEGDKPLPSLPEGAALANEKLASRPSVDHGQCGDADGQHPHDMPPPSPVVTRRNRRLSLSERASRGPVRHGKVKWFCRQRGHGFITPDEGGDDLFVHITDIEGEYAPHDGDEVAFKLCPCPPAFEKFQATHVTIRNLAPGVRHEKWSEAPTPHRHPHAAPNIPEARLSLSKEDVELLQHKDD